MLPPPAVEALRKAGRVAADALRGVLVFGSWARNELGPESDIDLLIVVEDRLDIERGLYREWDRYPLFWDQHRVEAHFVHLPAPGARPSGLWAELAVEGVVLYERDHEVSKRLVEFRQQVAKGRVVRRELHGQPYWVEVA